MALFSGLSRYHHFGLLVLRIGIGAMMIWHGFPKMIGGPDMWAKVGSSMAIFGVHDFPTFWGFMAAFAETVGGLLFLIGFLFRPALLLLIITMSVAALQSYKGNGMMGANHPIELGIVFLAMFIIGPGKYSIDKS
jgi:putative oxidoreductase